MNRKIALGICIILFIIAIVGVILLRLNSNIKDYQNQKEELFYLIEKPAAEGMEPLNKDIVLGDILQEVKDESIKKLTGISNDEADKLIDLKEYEGLEKKVAKYEDNNDYTEIWLFKISEDSQSVKLFRRFNERINSLREQYKDNKKIREILNNEENIIMKEQKDIAIIIISNKAKEVENKVNSEFIK